MSSISLAVADCGIEQVPFLENKDEWSENAKLYYSHGRTLRDEFFTVKLYEIRDKGIIALLTTRWRIFGSNQYIIV